MERIVEKPVYVDNIIKKRVEVPVSKVVRKPVINYVEEIDYVDNIIKKRVPVERIVEREVEQFEDVIIEKEVKVPNVIKTQKENVIYQDEWIDQVKYVDEIIEKKRDVIKKNIIR